MMLGPFDIGADRIEMLGTRFAEAISHLLAAETTAAGILGYQLETGYFKETTADGGVDAALHSSLSTDYLPAGNVAWQFKSYNITPKACANELRDAHWAHEYLKLGGSYVMVCSASLNDKLVESRRKKIAEKAIELELITTDDPSRIRFYDANMLARWMSRFPALAISRITGGPGSVAVDFDTWQSGVPFVETQWVADEARERYIKELRGQAMAVAPMRVRIQGESGIGKTRLLVEAMRHEKLSHLVAYVHDASDVSGELIVHLTSGNRVAVLVVDECPAERHHKLIEQIPSDSPLKVITIGPIGSALSKNPVIHISAMGESGVEQLLRQNYPQLSSEACRFVVDHSHGNIGWTLILADRVMAAQGSHAAELIARNDISNFIGTLLPEGADFFYATVLALFERIGWDREVSGELEEIASFAQTSVVDLHRIGLELDQRGMLERHGRYRAVSPHPLAVFLAAQAWRSSGDRILEELLPNLSEEMALALFIRVADLGRFEPARAVLPQLLGSDGPFASLETMANRGLGRHLTQLAIVLPDEVALHLGELVEGTSLATLHRLSTLRRDLVWTLEKLVWHRRTFEASATALLRLALAENESYANSATGTWLALFSTVIPATAATPDERMRYLKYVATSASRDIRLLASSAAAQALVVHEFVTVSGELQRGVLVEPRGTPATRDLANEYRRDAIDVLARLADDIEPSVSEDAANRLIEALHPVLATDSPQLAAALSAVVARFRGEALQHVRTEAEQLRKLYENNQHGDQAVRQYIDNLLSGLPVPTAAEQLATLVTVRRWDYESGELTRRIETELTTLAPSAGKAVAYDLLEDAQPNAWDLGRALALSFGESNEIVERLVGYRVKNPEALIGYLTGLFDSGDVSSFDRFLTSEIAASLGPIDRVQIAVRAPSSDETKRLVLRDLHEAPVVEGTSAAFGWHSNISLDNAAELLSHWLNRISSQHEYNSLVEWIHLQFHSYPSLPVHIQDIILTLLLKRRDFPQVSRQLYSWAQLAERHISAHEADVFKMLLEMLSTDAIRVHSEDADARVLALCARADPEHTWGSLAYYLQTGNWRVTLSTARWLIDSFPLTTVSTWIGHDIERARVVSLIARVGTEKPSPVARLLLTDFWQDKRVSSSLVGAFVSGVWWGNESDRIATQIEQLNSWRGDVNEPIGVRHWARDLAASLVEARKSALQREAEERP